MALVEFQNNSAPYLNAENLNNNFNELNNNLNSLNIEFESCKTLSFNNEWLVGHKIDGAGLMVMIPIYNPSKANLTINITNAEVFNDNQWKSITLVDVTNIQKTFVYLIFGDTNISLGDSCLIKIAGTITVV